MSLLVSLIVLVWFRFVSFHSVWFGLFVCVFACDALFVARICSHA